MLQSISVVSSCEWCHHTSGKLYWFLCCLNCVCLFPRQPCPHEGQRHKHDAQSSHSDTHHHLRQGASSRPLDYFPQQFFLHLFDLILFCRIHCYLVALTHLWFNVQVFLNCRLFCSCSLPLLCRVVLYISALKDGRPNFVQFRLCQWGNAHIAVLL